MGTHQLFARTDDGWVSPLVDVEILEGQTVEDVEVELEQGGLVIVRQTGGLDYSNCRVDQGETLLYGQGFAQDGEARLSLPAGRFTVSVKNRATGGEASFEVDVETGKTVERTVDLSGGD